MNGQHTGTTKRAARGVNSVSVTSGPSGGVEASFSPAVDNPNAWYPGKAPFGGDKAAERAWLANLRTARRYTTGAPW